jgi:FtsZ-binding cell division protein ZapB
VSPTGFLQKIKHIKIMSFAILRTQKLNAGSIGSANAHNEREIEVPNADPELAKYNHRPIGSSNVKNDVENRLKDAGINKTKKDAVLGIEHLMTASPEYFNFEKQEDGTLRGNADRWNSFKDECVNWLNDTYGKENVVNVHLHLDEKTPHIHAIVTPIIEKQVKWKNKQGEGFKTQNRLCAKDYLNGKQKMSAMQDSFANHLKNAGIQLERGIKGSKATHQEVQKFYTNIKEGEEKAKSRSFQPQLIEVQKSPSIGGRTEFAKQETTRINQKIEEMVSSFSKEKNSLIRGFNALKTQNNSISIERKKYLDKIEKLESENRQLRTNNTGLKSELKTVLKDYHKTLNGKIDKNVAQKNVIEKRVKHDSKYKKFYEKSLRQGKTPNLEQGNELKF